MTLFLYIATFLAVAIGFVHSILGERFILIRLFRNGNIPHLFGSDEFTIRTLRFAWHLTTVAWWGLGALLFLLAQNNISAQSVGAVIGATFLLSAAIALLASRGKHLSWIAFLIIGVVSTYVSTT